MQRIKKSIGHTAALTWDIIEIPGKRSSVPESATISKGRCRKSGLIIILIVSVPLVIRPAVLLIRQLDLGKRRFDRIEGVIFLLCYVGYTVYLLMR